MQINQHPVEELKDWFAQLPISRQFEVLKFLYGEYLVSLPVQGQFYRGPSPGMVKEGGLYCGPAPQAEDVIRNARICGECGRPY